MISESIACIDVTESASPLGTTEASRALDTRIEEELEQINNAIEEVNKLSTEFLAGRRRFNEALEAANARLKVLYTRSKEAVEGARPFYKARAEAYKAKYELAQVANRFRCACAESEETRENASTAERALMAASGGGGTMDPDLLANLNRANEKVSQTAQHRDTAAAAQQRGMAALSQADGRMADLAHDLSRHLLKSREYYETRETYQQQLEVQYTNLQEKHKKLQEAKTKHKKMFSKFRTISSEQRKCALHFQTDLRNLSRFEEIEDFDLGEAPQLLGHQGDTWSTTSGLSDRDTLSEVSMDSVGANIGAKMESCLDEGSLTNCYHGDDDSDSDQSASSFYAVSFEMNL